VGERFTFSVHALALGVLTVAVSLRARLELPLEIDFSGGRLHSIILASIINLCRFICFPVFVCGLHREDFIRIQATDNPPLLPEVYIEILGAIIRQVHEKSNRRNLRMSFKQLTGESITKAWERYHLFVVDLPVTGMEDWDFTQGFYYVLSQEVKEHIDNLDGGTFFLLKTQESRALFEKITISERESEE
jgi:hypothetical protein